MPVPSGAIPRVEVQWSHREFVDAVAPLHVLLSIVHAKRLLKRGETAASYFPDRTSVITTTTIADDHLDRLSWQDERDIVTTFEPAMHIPADYPVYGDDPPEIRYERAEQCATGTIWIADQLEKAGVDVDVLPLIKGVTETERGFGYQACEELDVGVAAVYAAQYFSAGGGGGRSALVRDLEAIRTEASELDVVVVGLLSPNYLEHVPENVIGAAGHRAWREPVAPRKQDAIEMREGYRELVKGADEALGINQPAAGGTPNPEAEAATAETTKRVDSKEESEGDN